MSEEKIARPSCDANQFRYLKAIIQISMKQKNKINIYCIDNEPLVLRPQSSCLHFLLSERGFTLVELVLIIMIVAILAVTAAIKWPAGMEGEAAAREFKHAFRYAQHQAMTREFTDAANAWGIFVSANKYTIQRNGQPATAVAQYTDRYILDKSAITLLGPAAIVFNGLGEPMTTGGVLIQSTDSRTYTVDGIKTLTFCPQTGFIAAGGSCP